MQPFFIDGFVAQTFQRRVLATSDSKEARSPLQGCCRGVDLGWWFDIVVTPTRSLFANATKVSAGPVRARGRPQSMLS